jgi:endonuclease/exonuclease/phosphatase (EEP) superfamily protein YafD
MKLFVINRLLCLGLVMTLFSGCANLGPERTPASDTSFGPDIDILIWNVYKASYGVDFYNDAKALIQSRELVLFQEASERDDFQSLFAQEDGLYSEFSQSWGRYGVNTAASVKASKSIPLRTRVREVYLTTPKSGLITVYPIENSMGEVQELMVLNVHMINFQNLWALRSQLNQYRGHLSRHSGPIIAAGDFNTWSNGRLEVVENFFKELGLTEIEFAKPGKPDPREKTVLGINMGVLDRLFIRGLEVVETKVYEDINTSDHKPFSARLRLLEGNREDP